MLLCWQKQNSLTDILCAYWKSYRINFDAPMGSRDILRTNRFLNSILKRRLIVLLSKDTILWSLESLLKMVELFLVNYTKTLVLRLSIN